LQFSNSCIGELLVIQNELDEFSIADLANKHDRNEHRMAQANSMCNMLRDEMKKR
jgi:hypothetical protein